MKRAGMVRVGLYLSEVQTKRIRTMAKKSGLTASETIRRMIDESLERHEKPKGKS